MNRITFFTCLIIVSIFSALVLGTGGYDKAAVAAALITFASAWGWWKTFKHISLDGKGAHREMHRMA